LELLAPTSISLHAEGRAMDYDTSALERAFELARSGRCKSVQEIRTVLKSEGYWVSQIEGKFLSAQLRTLIKEARQKRRTKSG
jgi:hypothetical protein